jgi:hypothetical protein
MMGAGANVTADSSVTITNCDSWFCTPSTATYAGVPAMVTSHW